MRTIRKLAEPASWRQHRQAGGAYVNYTQTDDARQALLAEQGHLCCFCMKRIVKEAMKIAHWAPQSAHDDKTMQWHNVMGACMGGDRQRGAIKHCDTHQGATPIKVNPVDQELRCEQLIQYLANGEIQSHDPDINKDLNETLNLNTEVHKPKRKQVFDILKSSLDKQVVKGNYWPDDLLERELERWRRRDKAGMFKEYCQVAIYFLEKWLRRRQNA